MNRRARQLLSVALLLAGALLAWWLAGSSEALAAAASEHGWQLAWPAQVAWSALALWIPAAALWSLTDLPVAQQWLQSVLRMALVVVLAGALAGPRHRDDAPAAVQVIHVIDRSASVPDTLLRQAEAAVLADGTAAKRGEQLRVDVVMFDQRAVVLPWPATGTAADQPLKPPRVARDPASTDATDLEAALNTALALVDSARVPHLVVWSDGVQTRGDAEAMVDVLAGAGVRVHAPKRPKMSPQAEVVVERLEVPAIVRANVPFDVHSHVRATHPAKVRCALRGPKLEPRSIERAIPAGLARIAFERLRLRDGGRHELRLSCDVLEGSDRFARNNQIHARVLVRARPKVLYVEGAPGKALYLAQALADDFEVTVLPADGLPRSTAELRKYAAVILSDVARVSRRGTPQLTEGDMKNLHAYVNAGGGLLVIGGEDSLGSGGYQDTYLDKHVLPVRMEIQSEVQQATIAMVLCIDRSGSMQGNKIELAKEAARATAEALGHDDKIGVFAFDNITRPVVRLQRAGNRYRISTDIGRLTAGGGTNIYPCLQMAYDTLSSVTARVKHVILLSDGKAPRSGIDALVNQMRRSGMTVTSVGVGAEVDRSLLEAIADRGGGRAYFTDRPETLPRIFVRETKEVSGESVIERKFRARRAPGAGRVDMLRGVDIDSSPLLLGYLPTRVKPGAEEILRASNGAPLLVRWRRELGKVTVWTSDLKNRWAHHWIGWPDYAVLARQLVRDLMGEELGARVAVKVQRQRGALRVAVDAVDQDDVLLAGLQGTATVRQPDGTEIAVPMREAALGRYEASTPMKQLGPYDVQVRLRKPPSERALASGAATVVHPYPDEHRLPEEGDDGVAALVAATGGHAAAEASQWRDHQGKTLRTWRWLWPDLVKLALLLMLLDIALRRVRLGKASRRSWFDRSR